jgi:endonuclease/exonuclease/phosphatase (EEP) superfamily protein YafD
MRVIRLVIVIGVAIAVVLAGIVVTARAFGWQAGPLYFLVALTPYWGLLLIACAVVAALLRAWWLVVPAAMLAGVVAWWWAPAFRSPEPVPGWDLQVMTTNLQFGRGDAGAVTAAVREHDVDLLSVQELTPTALRSLMDAGLSDELRYRFVRTGATTQGTGIWSRYPLSQERETDRLIFENLAAVADTPQGPVEFFAMHPIPPTPTDGNRGADISTAAVAFMDSAAGPAVVAGDLNATVDNVPMRRLADLGYLDAATAAGAGMVRTWPDDLAPLPPLVALDHVLTRDLPTAHAVEVVAIPGTDHRALIAWL